VHSSCDLEKNINVFKLYLEKVLGFFGGISVFPIKAEMFEQYIWGTLAVCYGEDKVVWRPGSHQRTVDVIIKTSAKEIRLAIKSGEYKSGYVTMSSYRLTSAVVENNPTATLRNMLNTISSEYDKVDYMILSVRTEENDVRRYQVYLIPPTLFKDPRFFDPNNWVIESKGSFWNFRLKPNIAKMLGINARIVGSMSYQLWYDIDQRLLDHYKLFSTPLEFHVKVIKARLVEQIRRIVS